MTTARPSRLFERVRIVGGFLVSITFGALRDFVWRDIRDGMIDLKGFARSTRWTILLGFALLFGMVALLLNNELWRQLFPLVGMPAPLDMVGRGRFVPEALVPVTYALLAIAWAFALTGLLHSHPLARAGILALYLLRGVQTIVILLSETLLGVESPLPLLVRSFLLLLVPVFFVLRGRQTARSAPAAEFVILLALVAAPMALMQAGELASWRATAIPILFSSLESELLTFRLLVTPLLLLIGIDVTNFVRRVAGWTIDVVRANLPAWVAAILLGTALIWRVATVIGQLQARIAASSLGATGLEYAGALMMPVLTGLVLWAVVVANRARTPEPAPLDETALVDAVARIALPLIVIYLGAQLASFVLLTLAGALPVTTIAQPLIALADMLSNQLSDSWRLLVYAAALALGVRLTLRRFPSAGAAPTALYLGIFGATGVWLHLTLPDSLLGALVWHGTEPVVFWWTIIVAVVAIIRLVRRQMDAGNVLRLLFATMVGFLMQQTIFVESRFSPLLGFAGVGFVAFGIVWDAITGAGWVNTGSAGLPRAGRVFLYVGYTILAVTILNWALAAHDLGAIATLTGGAADTGYNTFGKPLLYAVAAMAIGTEL